MWMTRDEANMVENMWKYLAVMADMHKKEYGEIPNLWMFCLDNLVLKLQKPLELKPNELRCCIYSIDQNDDDQRLEKHLQSVVNRLIECGGYDWFKDNTTQFA